MASRYRIRRPTVVRNVPPFSATGERRSAVSTSPRLIYVGRITHHRGLLEIVTSLGDLHGVTLRLVGPASPQFLAELLLHADCLGVRSRIAVCPPVAPALVVPTLRDADAGVALFQPVCLSHELVAPNKIFEYMMAGLPAVASDLPVIRSFYDEWECGVTANPSSQRDITERLREILDPERNRELRAAATRASRDVNWEHERRVLEGVYRDLNLSPQPAGRHP
jgi:glycosyltransferase involved in cell wall biosynthesis